MKRLNLEDFKVKALSEDLTLTENLIGGTEGSCHVVPSPHADPNEDSHCQSGTLPPQNP